MPARHKPLPRVALFEAFGGAAFNVSFAQYMTENQLADVKIICMSRRSRDLYKRNGIEHLCLKRDRSLYERGIGALKDIEERFSVYRLSTVIRHDRFLRWRWGRSAQRLIAEYSAQLLDFLDEWKPDIVLGESAVGIEYTCAMLCRSKDIEYRQLINLPSEKALIVLPDYTFSAKSMIKLGAVVRSDAEAGDAHESHLTFPELCESFRKNWVSYNRFKEYFQYFFGFGDYRGFSPTASE